MKKFFITVVVLIIGAAALYYALWFYVVRINFPTDDNRTSITNEDGDLRPDPSNATFIFDDGVITLSQGRNERVITPGSDFTEETALLDKLAYGDINNDKKEDVAVLLTRYGGGSGTFIYLAVFVSGPVTYRGSNAIFLGDRISPQSISISNRVITLEYLDRKSDEPFAAEPTVLVSKQFVYLNGELRER
ncbi:MAG: hypothetical protein Q8O71_00055 [bacterium]|nr:hypothetical protein [bacterium]